MRTRLEGTDLGWLIPRQLRKAKICQRFETADKAITGAARCAFIVYAAYCLIDVVAKATQGV